MSVTFVPDPGFTGETDLVYRVTNPDGGTSTGTVTVTVLSGGATVTPDEYSLSVGVPVYEDLGANDVNVGQGSTYTAQAALPAGLVLDSMGVLSGTPVAEFSGTIPVSVVSTVDSATHVKDLVLTITEDSFVGDDTIAPAFTSQTDTDADRINRAQAGIRVWEETYRLTAAQLAAARDAET